MNELITIYDGDPLEKELLKKDISFYDLSTKNFEHNNKYRNYIPAMRSSSDGTIIARIICHLKVIEQFKQKDVVYLLRKQSNKSF